MSHNIGQYLERELNMIMLDNSYEHRMLHKRILDKSVTELTHEFELALEKAKMDELIRLQKSINEDLYKLYEGYALIYESMDDVKNGAD